MPKRKKAKPSKKNTTLINGRGIYSGIAPNQEDAEYTCLATSKAQPAKHRKVKRQPGLTYGWNDPLPKFCKCGLPQASRGDFIPIETVPDTTEERMDQMLRDINNPFHYSYRRHIAFLKRNGNDIPDWSEDAKKYIKTKWQELTNSLK